MMKARTLGISIDCQPQKAYEYASNPENLPEWAGGLALSVRQDGREWKVGTPKGPMTVRVAPRNTCGVLDYWVKPLHGPELLVPMRVFPNGYGTEVVLTLFREQGQSEADFLSCAAAAGRALENLKSILQKTRAAALAVKPGKTGAAVEERELKALSGHYGHSALIGSLTSDIKGEK